MWSKAELEQAGLTDFRVMLRQVWDYLRLPEPTPVQYDIARYLQHGPKRCQISAFRGIGKSWVTTAFVLWSLLLNPELKIVVVSASEDLAKNFTTFCKQLMHGMPLLNHLAPRPGQRDSVESFDVGPATDSKDPSVVSRGITGQLTGLRADILIADDVEVPKNSYTHAMRERLAHLVEEFDSLLKPLPTSRIIYLGTPQVEDSLYTKLLRRVDAKGKSIYQMRVWPAEVPANPSNYGNRLAPYVQKMIEQGAAPGTPVDPKRFNAEELAERRIAKGLSGYALQFMLDTTPSNVEKHPLKLKNLLITDVDADVGRVKITWADDRRYILEGLEAGGFDGDYYLKPDWYSDEKQAWQGCVMAIDPSGMGRDETAVAVVKYLAGQLYLVHVEGFADGFGPATLKRIAQIAVQHKVTNVISETNYGGGMFDQLLKPELARAGAAGFDEGWNGWSTGAKHTRILETLVPLMENHRIAVDRKVIEADLKVQHSRTQYSLVQQLTRMENVKGCIPHEDRLEAVAMACEYWVERMKVDQDKAVEKHKDRAFKEEFKQFKESVFDISGPKRRGRGNTRIGWV